MNTALSSVNTDTDFSDIENEIRSLEAEIDTLNFMSRCPAIFGWANFYLIGVIMDFIANYLFYGIVAMGIVVVTTFFVCGIVLTIKSLRCFFEDFLDEMRGEDN